MGGIDYIARKDAVISIGKCIKHNNGRFYMSTLEYEKGRRLYWKKFFQQKVYRRTSLPERPALKWKVLVDQMMHRERVRQLIQKLKNTPFENMVLKSKLYRKAKTIALIKKTCANRCSLKTQFEKGQCRCYLCENWYGCFGRNTQSADLLKCNNCGYISDVLKCSVKHFAFLSI